jgi:2-oxoglutarate dehydrogenase E2 component (dihydrolipoamide succinyltransferase)
MTSVVQWRNKHKNSFKEQENGNLTFTPIFIEAVVKAIKDYPMINIQVDGDRIIKKKHINIGMAVALPSGNLIVPVIRDADQLNIRGLANKVNDLAKRARDGKLKAEELEGGTFTISNGSRGDMTFSHENQAPFTAASNNLAAFLGTATAAAGAEILRSMQTSQLSGLLLGLVAL